MSDSCSAVCGHYHQFPLVALDSLGVPFYYKIACMAAKKGLNEPFFQTNSSNTPTNTAVAITAAITSTTGTATAILLTPPTTGETV